MLPVTLHEELPGKQQQHNLYSGPTNYGPTNGERPQLNGGGGKQVEADNGISGLVEKTIDAYKNSSINQNESNNQIEFNEETMHNNILNRNIDLLLRQGKQQSSDQPAKANRINKYELVYGRRDKSSNPNSNLNSNLKNNLASNPGNNQTNPTRQYGQHSSVPLIRTTDGFSRMSNQSSFDSSGGGSDRQLTGRNPAASSGQFDKRTDARRDIRLLNDNSIEEISEANNSQTNSISSSSYLKFDVKGQPLMSFQSIAYVQANRLLNSNAPPHPGAQTSSLNKLMNLGSSNTSSDLPMYKMGESLDDSSLDSARIQDLCNLSSTSSNTESIKSSDTDDCPTLVDEMNNASFD